MLKMVACYDGNIINVAEPEVVIRGVSLGVKSAI